MLSTNINNRQLLNCLYNRHWTKQPVTRSVCSLTCILTLYFTWLPSQSTSSTFGAVSRNIHNTCDYASNSCKHLKINIKLKTNKFNIQLFPIWTIPYPSQPGYLSVSATFYLWCLPLLWWICFWTQRWLLRKPQSRVSSAPL